MPIEWGIIFLGTIAASAYFSYKSGFASGAQFGMDTVLQDLESRGIIELEYEEIDEE